MEINMATIRYTNLPQKNLDKTNTPRTQEEITRTFFDGYFEKDISITGTEWDVVYSFAIQKTENEAAARALSEAIIVAANQINDDPMAVINEFKKYDELQLDQVLSLYLNQSRRDTSLLGYTQTITPNVYVARNINI